MIYFDFDGVIRDLHKSVNIVPLSWDHKIDGIDFVEWFTRHPDYLLSAPPTEYFDVINEYIDDLRIITSQPETWHDYTIEWVNIYFHNCEFEIIFESNKLNLLEEQDVLVEDYPNYDDYSQIILIDKPYNFYVKNPIQRITKPSELKQVIEKYRSKI